jgi:hypothetical protein
MNSNTKFLQLHPTVAADALPEIRTAVISAVLLRDEHLSQTLLLSRNCSHLVHCHLIWCLLVGIHAAKNFTDSSQRI